MTGPCAARRCAGCGSKVGSTILNRAIKRLQRHMSNCPSAIAPQLQHLDHQPLSRADRVIAGIGDDAAVLQWPTSGPSSSMVMVQTIDYFRSFVADPYLFGRIAANHALSDLHAMLARPYSALALCSVPYGAENVVEDDLLHMLAGARRVLDEEDCSLVGGHTSEGAEPSLGFALTGYVHPDGLTSTDLSGRDNCEPVGILYKGPVVPGHALILTKALGTGVILAAAMPHRNFISCYEITDCYASMTQSNMLAARILAQFGCSACTDVTGFGFMGHLVEMVRHQHQKAAADEDGDDEDDGVCRLLTAEQREAMASLPVARIYLSQIPLLPGALRCSNEHRVTSSLFGANHRSAQQIINLEDGAVVDHPTFPILFDPQTSGGLLACVPRSHVDSVLGSLREAGYSRAAVIGEVLDSSETAAVVRDVLQGVSSSRADLNGCVFMTL